MIFGQKMTIFGTFDFRIFLLAGIKELDIKIHLQAVKLFLLSVLRHPELPKNGCFDRIFFASAQLHFSTDFKNFNGSKTYEACATIIHN